jgi:hypothetical protein
MKTLKKVLRIIILSFVIALAAAGAGLLVVFYPHTRERYMDKPIRIEQVDKKKVEDEGNEDAIKD